MASASPKLALVSDHPPTADQSDDALMLLAIGGDARAFDRLVQRHETRVRRLCLTILRDEAAARDVAQDTFLLLWHGRARYRPEGKLRELLLTMARHASRRASRRRAFFQLFGLSPKEQPLSAEPSAVDALSRGQQQTLVATALSQLPEHFRVPLVLRFVDELSYEEIARVIGRTESAARSRVHYGLKALAERVPVEVME